MQTTEVPAAAPAPPRGAGTLARMALVGAALVAVAATFAYLGGWLTPGRLTPGKFVDGLEQSAGGVHPGSRRNHAKGLGVSGFFEINGNGVAICKAAVFRPGRVPVIGRFSLPGGDPHAADTPETPRGLGLQFSPADGGEWRTSMINLPVFPFRTPEAFYEQMVASTPDPATGKPDPAKMQAFLAGHPETARVLGVIKSRPFSPGFENSAFYGLNAFRFVDAAGHSVPVRWEFTPEQPAEAAGSPPADRDRNYLFEGLIAAIHRGPLKWRLTVTLGQADDPTDDPTVAWPEGRKTVDLGTLTLDGVQSDETSPATDITFDPLVLPAGIVPSDDPFLSARSAVYSRSFTRRAGEAKQPPAITPADVRKGEKP
jgi:catalase